MNYLRNNDTGAQYNFDSAPMNQNALALDYASPIEFGGVGKGYRVKGDPYTAILADGRTVRMGGDSEATNKLQMAQLDMEKARLANRKLEADIAQAGRREGPTYQHVDTPNGPMAFNPRSGQFMPVQSPTGQPMQSKEGAQQTRDADSVMEITDEARKYVDAAPGSYLGAAANMAGRVFGADTDSAKAQAKLEVLGGALISKMPKMSGPQSDKDVLLYKQMAGNLNDPTISASAKNAAMDEIRKLNEKYSSSPVRAISEARNAIKNGAPRDSVIHRLQQMGIDTAGF